MQTTITKTINRNIQISQYTTVGHLAEMLTAGGNTVDSDSSAYVVHKDNSHIFIKTAVGDNTKLINSDRVIFTKADYYDAIAEKQLAEKDFHKYLVEKYS